MASAPRVTTSPIWSPPFFASRPRWTVSPLRLRNLTRQFSTPPFTILSIITALWRRFSAVCDVPGTSLSSSPLYSRDESGQRMLLERRAAFERQYGFSSDSIPTREYLTPTVLNELAQRLGIKWTVIKPWYGLNWAVRPLKARLLRRREPSKFYLFWSRVEK